ncbi:MAG: VapE family protein, partial [Thermodesulfobacteriota bacterium]|nr:VapE family protein [Thermodesulfobacteriota bacterium]
FRQDLIYKGEIINETVYNTIYLELCKDLGRDVPRSKFESVIKSLYIDQYHPIREFISQNADRDPAGTFEKWLDCLELKNPDLDPSVVLHFLKKWYVGLVAQALDGPFPNEFFLSVLSQRQGVGKTTLLRKYLLPEELRDYQAEHSLTFTDDYKVLMGQVLLLIDDELDGRSFEQSQSFKNILSTSTNTTRRKYDRRISSIKRRASFAGSGNSLKVVRERGERRIIPIEVLRIDRNKLNQLDLTDMFIEAYHLFMEGYQYSFQQGDKVLLDKLYGDYYQESDLDLIIQDVMDLPGESDDVFFITNLDIVSTLSGLYPNSTRRINTPNVGKKMAEHGFESKRVGRKKITCYAIGGSSRIIELLDESCQSWRLLISNIDSIEVDEEKRSQS